MSKQEAHQHDHSDDTTHHKIWANLMSLY